MFSTWIRPNQSGYPKVVHASKLLMRNKAILNSEPAVPITPQRSPPSPNGAAAKQTATLFIHSTSEHARGAWSDSRGAQRGSGFSTLLTPAARTRKVACNKTISFCNPNFNVPRILNSSWCSNSQFRKRTTARSHLSTTASFLLISSFTKQTSFVLLIFLFWGRGEGRWRKDIGGWGWGVVCVTYCSYYLLAFLPLSREGKS